MQHTTPLSASLICSQQATSQVPAHAVGCFKLSAGHALSLTPNVPGELRIAHGWAWLTFGHAADDAAIRAGDCFLGAGDLVRLLPGQPLVMEVHQQSTDKNAFDALYFTWEPDAATSKLALPLGARYTRCDVRQPLRDLCKALHQAGGALGRLATGVAGTLAATLMRRKMTVG
jgi:hypothetical protein